VPGLAHAFTVRGSDPATVLREVTGATPTLRTLRQVHGAAVHRVLKDELPAAGAAVPEGDALVTSDGDVALGVWVADCVPILLCDPERRALGAVHAGWRGTVAGVLTAAIEALRSLGSRPADLRAAFGPAIGACCFEVGEVVVEALLLRDPGAGACVVLAGDRPRLDLIEANRRQALAAGLAPHHLQAAGLCTFCRGDLLESYRRGGGGAGRMAGLIAWTP